MAAGISLPKETSWQSFYGENLGYATQLYDEYLANPSALDEATRAFFEQAGPPPAAMEARSLPERQAAVASPTDILKIVATVELARNIRDYGHLAARIDPLLDEAPHVPLLDAAHYQLTDADLAAIPAQLIWSNPPHGVSTALDAINRLRKLYTGTLAYDFEQVTLLEERHWLDQMVESGTMQMPFTKEEQHRLLYRLSEVEGFEKFLHGTFSGQKRFSLEGVDAMVPMLDELIQLAIRTGTNNIMIGMAHRGRLNVLAHVLGKPYGAIFSEFHRAPNKEMVPSEGSIGINYGWTGDVKYHLGANKTLHTDKVAEAHVVLANNPSHLEFVNPIVEGFTRAAQDRRLGTGEPHQDTRGAMAIAIHGDAAFPGEGINSETLNLSRLPSYTTGGTVHIIANNRLGFTAEPTNGRSTRYASDLAKGFEIPVVHVSADDPEACLAAVRMAHAYRCQFGKDFLIDLVGYRRWGHSEMDDPTMTQPQLYEKITPHPTARTLYAKALSASGVITEAEITQMQKKVQDELRQAYVEMSSDSHHESPSLPAEFTSLEDIETLVEPEVLHRIAAHFLSRPGGLTVQPKLERILKRRIEAMEQHDQIEWALAEGLAFATILMDGVPIRMTGQDSERGTFGHRHLVLHDIKSGREYAPLQSLPGATATCSIHNSPLSEAAVLGFEYGYNVQAPETLVIWEAQFGDFANVAQVFIDQFISSGRAKWMEQSGLVLLLPHGYEGQGPEHSSARVERYLQLCAENNWRVVNLTRAAQYFHVLRLQAASLKGSPRPLVVMAPKSLLRNPRAASGLAEFTDGHFEPVLKDPLTGKSPSLVKRLVLCTGKVAIDVTTALETTSDNMDWLAVARVEQLYPFPAAELEALLREYPNLEEIVWLQEEPHNMGAWSYIQPYLTELLTGSQKLRYVGRPEHSSPAEGPAEAHANAQRWIVETALSPELLHLDVVNQQ